MATNFRYTFFTIKTCTSYWTLSFRPRLGHQRLRVPLIPPSRPGTTHILHEPHCFPPCSLEEKKATIFLFILHGKTIVMNRARIVECSRSVVRSHTMRRVPTYTNYICTFLLHPPHLRMVGTVCPGVWKVPCVFQRYRFLVLHLTQPTCLTTSLSTLDGLHGPRIEAVESVSSPNSSFVGCFDARASVEGGLRGRKVAEDRLWFLRGSSPAKGWRMN